MRYTPAQRARFVALLAASALERENRSPIYARISRETGIDRAQLRRWWTTLGDEARATALAAAAGQPAPSPAAAEPGAPDRDALRAEIARLMQLPEDHVDVDIGLDLRLERDRTASDGPRAAATKELRRHLVERRGGSARTGPLTPDEEVARMRSMVELLVEALLGCPEALADERVWEAVDEARNEAAEGR